VIDERELGELLQDAANDIEVPPDGPATILAAADEQEAPAGERWWRTVRAHRLVIACAVVIVVVGATVTIREGGRGQREVAQHSSPSPIVNGPASAGPAGVAGPSGGDEAGSAGGSAGVSGGVAISPPPGDSAKIVKTGSVQLEVSHQRVGSTMTRLAGLATGLGGYVADTKTAEGEDDPSGSVTLRVPVDTFDQLLGQVRALGSVKSSTTHGQDVTAQYTDIQARLTALTATRDQLLTILHKATAIGDVLAVQDRINDVQTQIDQLQGQQKMLDDQTSMASLSVDVAPKGTAAGIPQKPSGISRAWDDARRGFTTGVEDILAASGTALVILLALVALAVIARYAWVTARRRTL